MKRRIRLNENDLHKIIKKSVKKFLNENNLQDNASEMFGNLRETIDSDELVDKLWFFLGTLGQQPDFINYMYTSGSVYGDEYEDFYSNTENMKNGMANGF